ncbi:MAG: dacB, partial [Phycisphaerales bacterium]|nr:dacB [Phycisphaerales bacterium]
MSGRKSIDIVLRPAPGRVAATWSRRATRGLSGALAWAVAMGAGAGVARGEVDAKLGTKLDAVLSAFAGTGATYVARVVEVASGRELYLHDPDRAVAPASNAKLATTAAALDRFGPGYVWRTYLATDGDDLWIVGTGDPACGDRRIETAHGRKRMAILDDWADALARRGVTRVTGKLMFDDGAFDDERVGATWPRSELTEAWSAPLTGLTLNGSCIAVTAHPERLEVVPETQGVTLVNRTRKAGKPEALTIEREPAADTFTVKGLVTKPEEASLKPIMDPGAFFADAVRTRLKARGITIDGRTERASRAAAKAKWGKLKDADVRDGRVVAVHETSMVDVLGRTNKQSQNLFADALCKLRAG